MNNDYVIKKCINIVKLLKPKERENLKLSGVDKYGVS